MPRKLALGTPEEWMIRSKSNLNMARQTKAAGVLWEDHCFQAHQAAEKALKAVYQSRGLLFEFVHDIRRLIVGLEKARISVPPEVRQAAELNSFIFETRYPDSVEPLTEDDLKAAVILAETVVRWAEKMVALTNEPGVREKGTVYRVFKKKAKVRRKVGKKKKTR
jgi:HEPN domain-containing protein